MTAKLQATAAAMCAPACPRAAAVQARAAAARAKALASMIAVTLAASSMLAAPAPGQAPAQTEDRALRPAAARRPPAAAHRFPAGRAVPSPLPAEKLQGSRLVDTDANLSIDLPGSGWEWSSLDLSNPEVRNVYAATNKQLGKRFVVMIFASNLTALRTSVLNSMRKGLPHGGAGVTFEDVAIPPGAKRCRFSAERGGKTFHCTDYVVATGRPVVLQVCSREPSDPPELGPWLASFRTLRKIAPPPPRYGVEMMQQFFLLSFFFIVGIGAMINFVAGRPLVNSWKLGGFAIALFAVAVVVAAFAFGGLADDDLEKVARLFGDVIGSALVPLVVSVVASNWLRKHRERQAQSALPASDPGAPPAD